MKKGLLQGGKFFQIFIEDLLRARCFARNWNVAVNNTATVFPSLVGLNSPGISGRAVAFEEIPFDDDFRPKTPTGEMKKFGAYTNPDLIDEEEPAIWSGEEHFR